MSEHLLGGIAIDMVDLAEFKDLPYDRFIEEVIEMSNSIGGPDYNMVPDYFHTVAYMEKEITINGYFGEISDDGHLEKITLYSDYVVNGFTNGQLLYKLAQHLSDYDDIEETYGNHAHFDGLLKVHDGVYDICT